MNESGALLDLLKTPDLPDLGPGPRAGVESLSRLDTKLQSIFKNSTIPPGRQELIRAVILLWHDHHETAHGIAQDLETADGAFIHGMVHRREPDYGNSKYWFRRVGNHPAFAGIANRAGQLLQSSQSALGSQLIRNGTWDPMAFIDASERVSKRSTSDPDAALLRQIQKLETECLLEYFQA